MNTQIVETGLYKSQWNDLNRRYDELFHLRQSAYKQSLESNDKSTAVERYEEQLRGLRAEADSLIYLSNPALDVNDKDYVLFPMCLDIFLSAWLDF